MDFLNNKISIYVPSTIEGNIPIIKQYRASVAKLLCRFFGGATDIVTEGYYLANNGELIKERINIVYSFCSDEQLKNNLPKVIKICEYLKKEMQQECISLEVNNKLTFILSQTK